MNDSDPDRCTAVTGQRDPLWALIQNSLSTRAGEVYRCQLEAGHEGKHRVSVCPFPGFADQTIEWE